MIHGNKYILVPSDDLGRLQASAELNSKANLAQATDFEADLASQLSQSQGRPKSKPKPRLPADLAFKKYTDTMHRYEGLKQSQSQPTKLTIQDEDQDAADGLREQLRLLGDIADQLRQQRQDLVRPGQDPRRHGFKTPEPGASQTAGPSSRPRTRARPRPRLGRGATLANLPKIKKPALAADILKQLPPTRKDRGRIIRNSLVRDPTITWTPSADTLILDGSAKNIGVRSVIRWLAQDKQ